MLTCKPDFAEAAERWNHFWNGELWKRPVLMANVCRDPANAVNPFSERYYRACTGRDVEQCALLDSHFANTVHLGESMPCFSPDFGPDQFAAFFDAELRFSEASRHTNWIEPMVDDWEAVLPLTFRPENPTFSRFLDYARRIAARAEGRYLVSRVDMHSNADALSALRGAERFCLDLYDCPDTIDRAMQDMRKAYRPVFEAVHEAGRMGGANGCVQYGIWHPRSFQVVQCDAICLLSPTHMRRFVLPALEEEVACHERTYFHLDGPGALRHLDDILALPIAILQWQPGDGQKPNWQWIDLFQRAQAAGKAVEVSGEGLTPDAVKQLHRELDPARVIYRPNVESAADFERLARWLETHG